MQGQREMIWAVLLLCAIAAHNSDGAAPQNLACTLNQEVPCFRAADYLNASSPVNIEVCVGKKLNISLEQISGYPICNWSQGNDPIINGSYSIILKPLSEADSGEYTLSCETSSGSRSSLIVSLHVGPKRPTIPHLKLIPSFIQKTSPRFQCVSEGCPNPTISWSGGTEESTKYVDKTVVCCAKSTEGEECSQLYDYDLADKTPNEDEVSNVTLSPGQSLLLRCRVRGVQRRPPVWESKIMDSNPLTCSPNPTYSKDKICTMKDSHLGYKMAYLFIESVNENHSGTYTCRAGTTKSVHIHVTAEGFLTLQLDERQTISVQTASTACLTASVSYHPVLQQCFWELPNKNKTKCDRPSWVSKQRTVKLCDQLKSGEYNLHVAAGGQKETKTISLCVAAEPKCTFTTSNSANKTLTCNTVSPVPANYSWMSCSSSNDSCQTDSTVWTEIPGTSETDSDISCNKMIISSLNTDQMDGDHLRPVKFCRTNSLGTWCTDLLFIQHSLHSSIGGMFMRADAGDLTMLKGGSVFLLVVLTVVSVALLYFVRKKKPKYQPQLQMIQMVGPNDNDYIYINFKDFQYDPKWEFPRENLELGNELGSGAFGMVVQATAYGINKPGVSQQVAVKMLKEKHQAVEKEALMSELKMLTHIGHHDNIVNLLGACTDSGPIYLIFQYCCYGDLLNYLKNNRECYHKSMTEAFNKDHFINLYHNLQPKRNSSELKITGEYVLMHPATTRGQENTALLSNNSSAVDGFEDPEMYVEPEEQGEHPQSLTFGDLLNFAYQVAKGMDFLSSKNCIHRDLAARNVLVTKGRLVKIGDFGLARDIDNDSNYVVRGNVRLPVKWMAPESIFEGMYTMKSDVWAYGILLWEIFSLGVTPYPGVKVDNKFYTMIERGFKMECPYYANESVYKMICKCWELEPCNRPPFSKLAAFMSDQLTDMEEKLYHNMLDQTSSVYQNAPAVLDISALAKEKENKTHSGNEYCQIHATEEKKATKPDSDAMAADEKHLKTQDRG